MSGGTNGSGGSSGIYPNIYGRRVGLEHQRIVKTIYSHLGGDKADIEHYIKIGEWGYKPTRHADIGVISNEKIEYAVQVVKTTASVFPVSREMRAMIDINRASVSVAFFSYNESGVYIVCLPDEWEVKSWESK